MKRRLLSTAVLTLIGSLAVPMAQAQHADHHAHGHARSAVSSGIELKYIEPSVRAQDDFFEHLNGKWLKSVEIPADKSTWGAFHQLRDDTLPQLHGLIQGATSKDASGEAKKIGDFYTSYMDEAKLQQLGITPLKGELAKIAAIKDKRELPKQFAHLEKLGVSLPFVLYIHQDAKDPTIYMADLYQTGLGMPDREYYLKQDDAKLADIRAKYQQHVEKMLTLAGSKNAAAEAKDILALETELAKVQWSKVDLRDPVKAYNKFEIAKLAQLAPGFDWNAWVAASGLQGKTSSILVSQPSYLTGFADAMARMPLESWKAYLQMRTVSTYANYLSSDFVNERFAFNGTTLSGIPQLEPRWKRAVSTLEGSLGDAVGKLYVKKYFPEERKAHMEKLVANLMATFKTSIDGLDWMSPATKKEAQDKLAKFKTKIGYPSKWKDYSGLVVKSDDLVGNVIRSRALEHDRELAKLGKPIDRESWEMTPQTVNAYYHPELNEIVFPAAILQPPFFDANADDAANYGGIGAVIGHEISHGFDDQGSQYDGDGRVRNWWTAEDGKRFAEKTKVLVEQYSAFSPLPGYHVNGELTLGENIGDNSGLAVAYKAYQLSLGGKPAPVIDGLTGDQRFFMGWGQVWRTKMREPAIISQIKTDPHSPGVFRANGTLRNQPGFYDAFKVKSGDKMYLQPEKRVTIW